MRQFTKPIAFYCYDSIVTGRLLDFTTTDAKEFSTLEEIAEFIEELRTKCDSLNRRKYNGTIPLSSTSKDNKTVIAMSDGNITLYFGRYDNLYMVGTSVRVGNDRYTIDLSDLKTL